MLFRMHGWFSDMHGLGRSGEKETEKRAQA